MRKVYTGPCALVESRRAGFGNEFLMTTEERTQKTPAKASRGYGASGGRPAAPLSRVPPLLPVLLPILVAAIVSGVLLTWLFPPAAPGGTPPVARFTDVTAEAGLREDDGAAPSELAPTTLGGGVTVLDYDGDGLPDIFVVGGTDWPWDEPFAKRISRGSFTLYHNDGHGHFTDVTSFAGLNVELQGMAAAAGDFDNDGRTDLFVTCVGTNHLFRNRGGGRFEDVTDTAGVGGEDNLWSTGATWIDLDGDGRLDLVVAHYARWPRDELQAAFTVANVGRSYGAPAGFIGAFPSVYRNVGEGKFVLLADSAGLRNVDPQTGFPMAKALAVVPVDANGDGRLDLIFSYHTAEAAMFLNQGNGAFRRWAGSDLRPEGVSATLAPAALLPLTQLTPDRFAAWQSVVALGARRVPDGFASLPEKLGVALLDYDLDGRLDIFSGGGRAEIDTNRFEHGREFALPPVLLWNRGAAWVPAPAAPSPVGTAGESWTQPLVARGVAVADFDGDGDLDVVIAQNGRPPHLLRNDQRIGLPWLQLDLVATRSAREAGGARVEVHTPRRTYVQTVAPAMSFMAQSTSTLTFGLGDDARVRRIVVLWPSGTRQELGSPAVNRRITLTEP